MAIDFEIEVALRSRVTLLVLTSPEEERVVETLKLVCGRTGRPLAAWDHADGFALVHGELPLPQSVKDPFAVLESIDKFDGAPLVLLRDFHQCWDRNPRVIRKLRTLAQRLKFTKKTIVVTMPAGEIPEELRDDAVVLEFPPPDADELMDVLRNLLSTPGVKTTLDEAGRHRLVRAALGLTAAQSRRVFAKALVSHGVLDERDIQLVQNEKKLIVSQSGALTFYPETETADSVGGLELLKDWLRLRSVAFSEDARTYGLPPPRGVALIGIPGTGKSLSAKMIAGTWKLPLVRLDVGALFGSLVGQSESNMRKALQLAETVAPCVLWIDELEKALSAGGGDGGTSLRVLGGILSWMQERKKPVFVVATANDISKLPPELLRRGRFDEVFFLDLPTAAERKAIFDVHLRKRKRDPKLFDLELFAAMSGGFVGAEIEQAIVDAMYAAYNDTVVPRREPVNADVVAALKHLVPLSRSQREIVDALRHWLAEGRAQSASFRQAREAVEQFVAITPMADA